MGRKSKPKNAFVFKKNGQDWGPFSLKELVDVALEGDLVPNTQIRDLANNSRTPAGKIKDVAMAIHKYNEKKAHELELQEVEAGVVRLEKRSGRRKWEPILIIVAVVAVAGTAAWMLLVPKARDNKFVARLMFKDIDLVRLTPLASSGVMQPNKKVQKTIRHHPHKVHIVHHWEAMTDMDFSHAGSQTHGKLTGSTILALKKRFGQLVSECARTEMKKNARFHDATAGFLLKNSGSGKLTSIESQSGVSKAFMQCAKRGAARIHFAPYGGSSKVVIIPISRR